MTSGAFQVLSADELNRFVTARAKLLTPGAKGWGRTIGTVQQDILVAAKDTPLSVRDAFAITCSNIDKTIDALAGLLARDLIEAVDGKWRTKAEKANAA